ncbi:MoaD/ThiS family protein [Actinomadura rubrisoli]|uniref:MoaD/ThiS family protein n=1 Tax=Actinomadura rubrisoli TaxID=2530368 RepID=A0A4R5BM49_9ACTN|nr:MoaD/ThiS family protein [Actinomadura rubrisoli]TDD87831.1 MoaD/ThiS family protein [Actinomadura rubrisoli]
MTTFRVSGALLRFTDFQPRLRVADGTVQSAIDELVGRYPGMAEVLYDRNGRLRRTHRFALNGELLTGRFLHLEVGSDDQIDILLAVSGG